MGRSVGGIRGKWVTELAEMSSDIGGNRSEG